MKSNQSNQILARRPEARGFKVEQLLQEATDGRLRIPPFQRPLRWKSKHVIDYFDSIRRGFPVGDLLLSRDMAVAEQISFGPFSIAAVERHDALWVIDGQQRITALVATLLRKEKTPKLDYWAIWYDLEKESFIRLARREPEVSWIPLNVINDSVSLLRWIKNWDYADDNPEWVDRALNLGKAIREYELPAYIVDGAAEQALRLIFTRVNTAGVGMRESEIFEARYGQEGNKPIQSAVARLQDTGFGEIKQDLFLRCLKTICGDLVEQNAPEALSSNLVARTEIALRRAIKAIQSAADIPQVRLLPYQMPLIFLSAFYDRFPQENSRVDRMVSTWIWNGAIFGVHENSTDHEIQRLHKRIDRFDSAEAALACLLAEFAVPPNRPFKNEPHNNLDKPISLGSATGKIFVLSMLSVGPLTPTQESEQQELALCSAENEGDSISSATPEMELDNLLLPLCDDGKIGTDVVIRTKAFDRDVLCRDVSAEFLQSHVLDCECRELLCRGDFAAFRECRRGLLQSHFDKFVASKLGDRNDFRPSIQTIIEFQLSPPSISN